MIRNSKKHGVGKVFKRKPYQQISEALKSRVAGEILRGEISLRAASTKYCMNRRTLYAATQKVLLSGLINNTQIDSTNAVNLSMKEKQLGNISAQEIKILVEELKKARLKIEGLETMIDVAEDKFNIKIRKKAGTKQSRACGKDIRK